MNIIYFQDSLTEFEKNNLRTEFPNYHLIFDSTHLSPQQWKRTEIFYGHRLSPQELNLASKLHWIHVPSPFLHNLCLEEIFNQTSILLTNTQLENLSQTGEYLWATVLAFAKQLFYLYEQRQSEAVSSPPQIPWQMTDRCFLQLGMGYIGQELVRRAYALGCKVWGVGSHRSTYEHCHKSFEITQMHSILPQADIVSIFNIRQDAYPIRFGKAEFELMKQDSILLILGSRQHISEADLYEAAKSGKFRGIIIDSFLHSPVSKISPLRKLPNTLITTTASSQPKKPQKLSFQVFKKNLRLFENGNFSNMKNTVAPKTEY